MIEQWLWIAGSLIFIILGSLHLLYTFFTNKFSVRDKTTEEMMKNTSPVLTRKITMWKAWVGFNASHSIGAIFCGGINFFFATCHFEFLANSFFLLVFTCLTSLFYLFLGFKYWFSIPCTGTLVSSVCFVTAIIIIFLQ